MLTNLFYYAHYRPYTIQENGNDSLKKKIRAHEPSNKLRGKGFLLNKSCKSHVISFARNISCSITGLRESAKRLDDGITRMQQFNWYGSPDSERYWLKEDFKDFVLNFNEAYKFSSEQDHNSQLSKFAVNIKQYVQEMKNNSDFRIKGLFINYEKDLTFDEAKYDELNFETVLKICASFKAIAAEIKNETEILLTNPLTSFMNFKNLASYYNYKFGSLKDNTYKIIETGTLYDLII